MKKTIFALILCVGAMAAETNVPPPAATNLIILNPHQQFYRAIEIRRSAIRTQQTSVAGVAQRLSNVIGAKGDKNSKGEQAELKKYHAASDQLSKAYRALDVQVAEYELHNADAKQWANWWARTNAAAGRRTR